MRKLDWKILSILGLLAVILIAAGTQSNTWYIGDGNAGDKVISVRNGAANAPKLTFNNANQEWRFSNDGVTEETVASSGQTFTFGETLAANDPLEMRSDGKVYKLQGQTGDSSTFDELEVPSSGRESAVGYSSATGKHIYFQEVATGVVAKVLIINSDGTFGFGPEVLVSASSTTKITACSNTQSGAAIVVIDGGGTLNAWSVTESNGVPVVGGTGSTAIVGIVDTTFKCVHDPVRAESLVTYRGTSGFLTAVFIDDSGANPSFGTLVNNGVDIDTHDLEFDAGQDKFVISYTDNGSFQAFLNTIDTSSGTPVFGTPTVAEPGTGAGTSIAYDANGGGWALFYSGGGTMSGRAFTLSGTTFTIQAAQAFGLGASSQTAIYSTFEQKIYLLARTTGGRVERYTSNGTTLTLSDTPVSADPSFNWFFYSVKQSYGSDGSMVFSGGDTSDVDFYAISFIPEADGDKFIGIAGEAGVLNDSKSVTLAGPSYSGFSGQTPGDFAYIQSDGSYSTAENNNFAGVFLSATDLVITKMISEDVVLNAPFAQTGDCSSGNVCSGNLTPIQLFNQNFTSPVPNNFNYTRLGDVVFVTGRVSVVASSTSRHQYTVSVPIPSSLTLDANNLNGVCGYRRSGTGASISTGGGVIGGNGGANCIVAPFASGASADLTYSYSYRIK